jgi:hypothetical protein
LYSLRRPSRSSSTCTSVQVPPMSIAARIPGLPQAHASFRS